MAIQADGQDGDKAGQDMTARGNDMDRIGPQNGTGNQNSQPARHQADRQKVGRQTDRQSAAQ